MKLFHEYVISALKEENISLDEFIEIDQAQDPNNPSEIWCKIIDRAHEIKEAKECTQTKQ